MLYCNVLGFGRKAKYICIGCRYGLLQSVRVGAQSLIYVVDVVMGCCKVLGLGREA